MLQIKKIARLGIFMGAVGLASNSMAFGLGSLPGLGGGGGGSSSNVDTTALLNTSNEVIGGFGRAFIRFNEALGLKDDSGSLAEMAKCSAQACAIDGSTLEAAAAQSEGMGAHLDKLKADGVQLDADAKAKFASGMRPYLFSTLKGVKLITDLPKSKDAIQSKMKSNPFGALGELKSLLTLNSKLPPMIESFSGASGKIWDFANYQGLPKPSEEEAASE